MMRMQDELPLFNYNYLFKLVVVGDATVGKSSFLKRIVNGDFNEITEPTVGVDFFTYTVTLPNGKIIKSHIWDTAGQEAFRSIIRNYYRNAAGMFLMYDVSNRNSFESLGYWVNEIKDMDVNIPIILIANKTDLKDNTNKKHITYDEGCDFADKHGFMFHEISNKSSSNHHDVYKQSIQYFYEKLKIEEIETQTIQGQNSKFNIQGVTQRKSIKITNRDRKCTASRQNCCCIC